MNYYIGIDLSKATFNYAIFYKQKLIEEGKVSNNNKAIRAWLKKLPYPLQDCIFIMEHTGVYNQLLIAQLVAKKLTVCVEKAMQIKRSVGDTKGKNDRIDAIRIAEYAYRFHDKLSIYMPKRKQLQQLKHLLSLRKRVMKIKNKLTVPLKELKIFDKAAYKLQYQLSEPMINNVNQQIKAIDKQIKVLINTDEQLKQLNKLTTSVPGIGIITSAELILRSNEFTGITTAKAMASYAGVAPFKNESGSSIKGRNRVSHKANKNTKTLLHLAAMAAIRSGEIKLYYERKVAEGKNKMLVINAVRNKLLHIVFACVEKNVTYQKNYKQNLVLT